ncbi:hypothetical protein GF358_01685 [Candidatus Woesearchaeota archaeon]|nr:hypothetical protein [Candidatus Woesearchaeota archaeon]
MNKKAALQLSINAIVILILAITILSLGIAFIRSQFGTLTERFTEVSAEIKSELINKIKDSGDLLVFNRVEIEAKLGKPEEFYIGIKNTAPNINDPNKPVCFIPAIKCISALNGDCLDGRDNVYVGGTDMSLGPGNPPEVKWFSLFPEVNIQTGEVNVYPIELQIAQAQPDTYLMEFAVYKYQDGASCDTGGIVDERPYQSKQFFIKLS